MTAISVAPSTELDDPRKAMLFVINVLMRRAGIRSKQALADRLPQIKQSTVYTRLDQGDDGTDWKASELRWLADALGVPVGVLFTDPSMHAIAQAVGESFEQLTEQVVALQNWKKLSPSDLRVLPGGTATRKDDIPRHPQLPGVRHLTVVPQPLHE